MEFGIASMDDRCHAVLPLIFLSYLHDNQNGIERYQDEWNLIVDFVMQQLHHGKNGFLHMQKQRRRSASLFREADQRLCFRYTDSTIPLLPKSEISSL